MIKIYKDNDVKVVTKGAYENIYKSLGYNLVIDVTEPEPQVVITEPVIAKDEEPIEVSKQVNKTVTQKSKKNNYRRNKRED